MPAGPAQQEIYSKVQRQIVDDVPMVFLYHATRMAAVGEWVQGLELNLGNKPHDKLVNVDVTP
jgi:ABC-type transport system substrate-binding protein